MCVRAIRRRTASRRGFTLAELLVAMVIAAMASAVALRSLSFSLQLYQSRTEDAASRLLCDTVSAMVKDDLTKRPYGAIPAYATGEYGKAGEIGGVTLPDACYGANEARQVKISVTSGDDGGKPYYSVSVSVANANITDADKRELMAAKRDFTVEPLG